MKWKRGTSTEHVRDERGQGGASASGMGGLGSIIGGMGALGKGGGVIGIVVALVIVFLGGRALTGGGGGFDVGDVLEDVTGVQAAPAGQSFNEEAPDPQTDFIIFVFNDTQSLWEQQLGQNYQPAELVLFSGFTQSACGGASSGVGPHYCPADGTVRIDNDFFRELSTRFGAPGDFAQAYVIAHEMGHHVQNVTGISGQVHEEERNNPDEANELSVRLELQADCLAGVWAHQVFARGDLEAGDIDEALAAAAAVGDDTIQQQATGTIDQDTWTHGSAEQRSRWFTTGYESGDPASCDTF